MSSFTETSADGTRKAAGPTAAQRARRLFRVVRRVWRALIHKSSKTVLVLYALGLSAVLGLVSADIATRGGYPFGGVVIGAWTAWPRVGSLDADPYARAIHARRGEIPLAVGEGMLVTASSDDDGRKLDATCTYGIGGAVPPARAWTVTVYGRDKTDPERSALREGFTSTEVLRDRDGRFSIVLSPSPQPGNWLPMPRKSGPVRLALRLYDTPVAASVGSLDRSTLPAITRLGCTG